METEHIEIFGVLCWIPQKQEAHTPPDTTLTSKLGVWQPSTLQQVSTAGFQRTPCCRRGTDPTSKAGTVHLQTERQSSGSAGILIYRI